MPNSSGISSKNKDDPPSNPPSNPNIPSFVTAPGDPPTDPSVPSSSNALDPPSGDSQKSPSDPKVPITMPLQEENTQKWAKSLGAIIYNAFGKHGPHADGFKSAIYPTSLAPQTIFTAGALTFTANPTGFTVKNAAISPGAAARTVDGTSISLDNSGVLGIDSSTTTLTNPSATPILAVAGQTFTSNPSAFSIAGTTISAGGPVIAIDGTTVSLDRSGALAIGSSTFAITALSYTPNQAYTVAGHAFTLNPSEFSIADTTVSAGDPAVTADGTTISLGQSGALAIGSYTVDLPTQSQTPSNKAYTVAGQTFTPNPSAFSIASTTISAGGPAITVGGTIITLQASGTLVAGSSTIPLLTPQATVSSDVDIDGFEIKVKSSFDLADGVTLLPGAAGVTVSGKVVSLEASRVTLDIGSFYGWAGKGARVVFTVGLRCLWDSYAVDMTMVVFLYEMIIIPRKRVGWKEMPRKGSMEKVKALELDLGCIGSDAMRVCPPPQSLLKDF